MPSSVVVDGFFGDTGKGKISSYLALKDDAYVAVRGGVGTNAGHTVVVDGEKYKLSQLPSGFVNERAKLLIGPGVLVDPRVFNQEVEETKVGDRVGVDFQCGIIEERHVKEDRTDRHLSEEIGSTGTGCGPAQRDRVSRSLSLAKDVEELESYLVDVPKLVDEALRSDEEVLVEGSQGTFISLYHGTYPYVTSKDVTAASLCADVGLAPNRVDRVVLVLKSYVTRVGEGPLEDEMSEEEAKDRGWEEVATVTGRTRRVAPFNYELASRAVMLNGATDIALTKVDAYEPRDKGKTEWSSLSEDSKSFVKSVEDYLHVPVTLIGTGPGTDEIVDRRE